MSNRKRKYFTVSDLKKIEKDCRYLFLLGERANGKSYSVKSHTLKQAFDNIDGNKCTRQLAYIRRFDLDCKDSICEPYFADMPIQEITDGKYTTISVFRKRVYFANVNIDTGKVERGVCIGQCFALSSAEHYKSLMFPNIYNLIYEEVISENNQYLYQEPQKLQQLVSTILRDRVGKVYLIGNTLSRFCPYYKEFGLKGVESLDLGETKKYIIDDVVIKVHRCNSRQNNTGMFFGNAKKNIEKGEYITYSKPHLEGKLSDYNIKYTVVLKCDELMYLMRFLKHKTQKFYVWYIEPKTTPIQYTTRVIANEYNSNPYWTRGFLPMSHMEEVIFKELLKMQRVVYSDNLTGTEFEKIIDNFE